MLFKDFTNANYVVYDGECPFCSQYVKMVRLSDAIGKVELINARDGGELVDYLVENNYDLNEGMVLVLEGNIHYGPDCVNKLALLSSNSGIFNRLNGVIFKRPLLSKLLYPVLKLGRRIVLTALGRDKIKQTMS